MMIYWKVSVLVLTSVFLIGCATSTGGSFCAIAEPIFASEGGIETRGNIYDTSETLRQIDSHNAAYESLCVVEVTE